MLVCRWSPQKSLDFHSKCERFMQNPRFHRSTYVGETKNAAKAFIFIGNSLKNRLLQKRVGRQSLQTRCPNRDKSSILTLSFLRRPGRQRVPNTMPKSRPRSTEAKKISLSNECGPPRGGQPRNLYPMKNESHICRFVEKKMFIART